MRILLVKTSSLGDVIHNLPVAADLARQFPGAEIDWCVEEAFTDIPRLSPLVRKTLPVAVRRWRKNLLCAATWREIGKFRAQLKQTPYDAVLDTQGLLKSALIAGQATGPRFGFDAASAREPIAARFYDRHFAVPRQHHAILRNRLLAAAAFGYALPDALDFGIQAPALPENRAWLPDAPFAVFLSATSRDDKLWPERDWIALGRALGDCGLRIVLPGGNRIERERAARIAAAIPEAAAAPPLGIHDLAAIIGHARIAVGVDTGLVHLAAALGIPTVALYTATDPALTGVAGCGFTRNLGGRQSPPGVDEVLASSIAALS